MGRKEGTEETEVWHKTCEKLKDFDAARKSAESGLHKINRSLLKLKDKSERDSVSPAKSAVKLLGYYQDALAKAEQELRLVQDASEAVNVLIGLREATERGVDGKRKRRKLDKPGPTTAATSHSSNVGSPAPFSGENSPEPPQRRKLDSEENSPIPLGSEVAVKPPDKDWLLAKVVGYRFDKNGEGKRKEKYEVEDVEDDEDHPGTKKRYIFPVKSLIFIPEKFHFESEHPIGAQVLALFPTTTCFYLARVMVPPSRNRDSPQQYIVMFDDDNAEQRLVQGRYVLSLPVKNVRLKA
ncbi:hypothetical protein M427DRAFT_366644 [Gonapodya prolifera JEL478]|uniref:SGF29 C-terminal domain-containing protein n=1 Tax=Gonapodya prolifera (strain JEL478) TaxID=1344416 RepID=A0A139AAK0_GONPJ|nr:hypothetical protein M427DRAFT_366644 [Gonapodya prolifera JEL478]|eukprot:KXS13684.1 hypothetical protein M427DRAFT_366644 [Gonapodya prolifera JEL478]